MNDIRAYVADRDTLFHELKNYINSHQVSGKKLAVLLIKIDQFRRINMIHGYEGGDYLLDEFSIRLLNASREKDYLARMGNAEFIMILPEIMNEGHAILAANKLLNSLDDVFELDDKKLKLAAHIGISICSYPNIISKNFIIGRDSLKSNAIRPAQTNNIPIYYTTASTYCIIARIKPPYSIG